LKAERINQPTSGKYEEKVFDLNTEWKSQNWSWIKFTTEYEIEWIGVFRGEFENLAIAEKINQVAILTSGGLYILDIEQRETLYFEKETEFKGLAEIPTKDKFIIAEYQRIGIIDKNFEKKYINLEYEIENIVFGKYENKRLKVNFEKLPDYQILDCFLNTENWKIKTNKNVG
jgi:hypothetical protein